MLTASFIRNIESTLGKHLRKKLHIRRVKPVSGGSINHAARLDTTEGTFFMKVNDVFQYPQMFQKEAKGLEKLRSTNLFSIPKVILTGDEDGQAFLILEFIESRTRNADFWKKFGMSLADLHKSTDAHFGLEEDNYIGSLAQSNKQYASWINFFIEERLEKQFRLAMSTGRMISSDGDLFKRLYMKLESIIPVEGSALLHGDLWSGNFITGDNGEPCIFDPAVYFGHREMDLSMTKLFGGFEEEFYQSYSETFPLSPGFDDRIEIHNLYPLMVHVNLFGGGYTAQVRAILKKYQ